jgi:hypothetical protein
MALPKPTEQMNGRYRKPINQEAVTLQDFHEVILDRSSQHWKIRSDKNNYLVKYDDTPVLLSKVKFSTSLLQIFNDCH